MATATGTGPIAIGQINSTIYAGEPGFPNTQYCVDYARNDGNYWLVTIPQGYAVSEPPISAITGGTAQIYIMDLRLPTQQLYKWDGTKYVPQDFGQLSGFVTFGDPQTYPASLQMGFDPTGTGGNGTATICATGVAGQNVPNFEFAVQQQGAGQHVFMTAETHHGDAFGEYRVLMPQGLYLLNFNNERNLWIGDSPYDANGKGMFALGRPSENAVDLQGNSSIGYDQTIRLNHYGGNVEIALLGTTSFGDITAKSFVATGVAPNPPASLQMGFDPTGTAGHGTATICATGVAGMNVPNLEFAIQQQGSGPRVVMRAEVDHAVGTYKIVIPQGLYLANFNNEANLVIGDLGVKAMYAISKPAENAIDFQGSSTGPTYDQTIRLNRLGGDVEIAPLGTTSFGDVEVNGSPVRTFANSPYPPTGIPQSTGTAWGASINPATLQGKLTVTTTGTNGPSTLIGNTLNIPQYAGTSGGMVYPDAGIGVSTGTAWGTSIDPATLQGKLTLTTTGTNGAATLVGNALNVPQYTAPAQVYPGAGVPVSTGTAWGTPIDPATLVLTNRDSAITGSMTLTGSLSASGGGQLATVRIGNRGNPVVWQTGSPNINATSATDMMLNASGAGGLYFNWDQGTGGVKFGNGAAATVAAIDATGNFSALTVWGNTFLSAGAVAIPAYRQYGCHLFNNAAAPLEATLMAGGDGGSRGKVVLAGTGPSYKELARFTDGGSTVAGNLDSTGSVSASGVWNTQLGALALAYDAATNIGQLVARSTSGSRATIQIRTLNNDTGQNSVWAQFGPPATQLNGDVNVGGNFSVAGTKAFKVPHPLDDTKDLYHACLEGPENGVFYRGEVTTANGTAEVTLPDYFEALTFPEDRSVLLTVIVDDANPVFGAGQIAAGRVKDGKFKVYSSDPSVTIAWEVKAVRRINVDRLKVVTDKPEPQPLPTLQDEKTEA